MARMAAAQAPLSPEDPLLSVRDVARMTKRKDERIREAQRAGELRALRLGRHLRFRRSEVERWLRACEVR